MKSEKKLVEVCSASEVEAQVIKGMLESYGILCLLQSHAAPSVHMFSIDGMGEVKVLVREEAAEEARRLIKGG